MDERTIGTLGTPGRVRCAIYTRKSTEEGLEQTFNSLDAQREAAEAYIQSQKHVGWTLVETRFDDGGFSGGNMERPALQQLLKQIDARQVDCVLVYKVDRLTRSLADFAKIVEAFRQRRETIADAELAHLRARRESIRPEIDVKSERHGRSSA